MNLAEDPISDTVIQNVCTHRGVDLEDQAEFRSEQVKFTPSQKGRLSKIGCLSSFDETIIVTPARRQLSMIPRSNATRMPISSLKQLFPLLPILIFWAPGFQAVNAQEQNGSNPEEAKELETSILRNTVGFTGDALGAEIIAVTPGENDTDMIDIVIPVDPDNVDQVRATRPDGTPFNKKRVVEITRDHENKEVGVVLRLNKKDSLGFRLKLIDMPDDQ